MNTVQRRSKGQRDHGVPERLLAATRRCVRDQGLSETSSRAIADEAGVNLASITYYFGSKEDLLARALADELLEWIGPALDRLSQRDDPVKRLLDAVTLLSDAFDAQRHRVDGLLEVFVHTARDGRADNSVVVMWSEVRSQLSSVINELRSRSVVPTWIEPDAMSALIMAVVAGTVVNETVNTGTGEHRAIALQFANLLIGARDGS